MADQSYHIESQITKYLAGECSLTEEIAISGLIQSDDAYRAVYNELSQVWNGVACQQDDTYDIDQAWANVSSRIAEQPLKVIHRSGLSLVSFRRVAVYASSVAAALIIGLIVFQLVNRDKPLQTFASLQSMKAPVALSDGSHIVLNSNSELKYPEKFGSHSREVYFWGEAFFEIASDPTRPFVIETGDARVKVLGTSFGLKALPESGITEVVVNSGTVLFYRVDKNDQLIGQITLEKGEKGTYMHSSGKLSKSINDDSNFFSWKTGILVFNETTLDKVMDVVGKKYGVSFHMADPELSSLKLTATFDNESLDSVLEVLKLVHKLQFTHNGKDYLVKK